MYVMYICTSRSSYMKGTNLYLPKVGIKLLLRASGQWAALVVLNPNNAAR